MCVTIDKSLTCYKSAIYSLRSSNINNDNDNMFPIMFTILLSHNTLVFIPTVIHPVYSLHRLFSIDPSCIILYLDSFLFLTSYSSCTRERIAIRQEENRGRESEGYKEKRIEMAKGEGRGRGHTQEEDGVDRPFCKKRRPKCRPTGSTRACTCHVYPLKCGARERDGTREEEKKTQTDGEKERAHMCVDTRMEQRRAHLYRCACTRERRRHRIQGVREDREIHGISFVKISKSKVFFFLDLSEN